MSRGLEAADAIARGLVADAIWHEDRCTWLGPMPEKRAGMIGEKFAALPPDLYAGAAGVGLVLAEMAAVTGDRAQADTAAGALRQALARAGDVEAPLRIGLFTGDTGIALAAVRGGRAIGDEALVTAGVQVAAGLWASTAPAHAYDVVGGRSGAVLGSLALAAEIGAVAGREWAARLGDEMIAAAHAHGGWAWTHEASEGGLSTTGLAHGTAGVACALMELWAETGEARFRAVADEAIAAEEALFDAVVGNWRRPDGDAGGHDTSAGDQTSSVSWCNGSAGIGLARARAWQLTGDERRRVEAAAAVRVTAAWVRAAIDSGRGGFSLCHGLAGNAEMLADCAAAAGDAEASARALAREAGEWGAQEHGRRGRPWEDCRGPGLMTGLAGVARFHLRAARPGLTSVLLPVGTIGPGAVTDAFAGGADT